MSDKAAIGLGAVLILTLAGAGTYLVMKKTPPPPASSSILLSGSSAVSIDTTNNYTVAVFENNNPVTGAAVSLKDSAGTIGTATTDTTGTATFSVKFTSSGTDTLYAEYNGIKSSSLTVTVSSTPPPSGCISCSDCPPGYNCVNGTCEELIPASINIPPTIYPKSLYLQYTIMVNNIVTVTYALLPMSSNSKSCPGTAISLPIENISSISVNGTVTDSAGHGVNGITVNFNVSGGGNWTAGSSGNSFSGTTALSMKYGSAVTDCNGNFTAEIIVTIKCGYNCNSFFTDCTLPFTTIPMPTGTLNITSGNLPRASAIISFNDFIATKHCDYVDGVLL